MNEPRAIPAKPKRTPLLSRVPAGFVRAVLKGHSSLGLAFAVGIYLVCLSGSLSVFAREFQRWENPNAPRAESVAPAAVQRAIGEAIAREGKPPEHAYIYPPGDLPWLLVMTDQGGGEFRSWLADANGRVVGEARKGWSDFIVKLHIQLHLPRTWGGFLVGLVGVCLLSLLISGLLAHPRIFRDAFHLRLGGSRRLQEADLHNRLGVWGMPFHLLVSTTGALLGLTTLIVGVLGFALFQGDVGKVYGLFVPPEPKENAAPAPLIKLQPMFADVARRVPDGRVTFIGLEHPLEQGAGAMFNVETPTGRLVNLDSYTYDRTRLYHSTRASDNNLGEQILGAIGPLHFGWFGGGLVKIAYGLLGLAMTHLAASGVTIWLARRRDKGNPSPRWERVWTACVWGQALALAATALVAVLLAAGDGALLTTWGFISLAAIGTAVGGAEASRLSRIGRIGTAGLLLVTAFAHLVVIQGAGGDPIGWMVDGALLLGAFLLVRRWRPRTA